MTVFRNELYQLQTIYFGLNLLLHYLEHAFYFTKIKSNLLLVMIYAEHVASMFCENT